MRIACVGIAVQDRLYYVDNLPDQGGKYVAKDYHEMGGGPAATAAVTVARLGANVDFIGRVGDDTIGQQLLLELQQERVNSQYCKVYPAARSTQSAILVDKQGERIIVNYPSPDLAEEASWLNDIDFSQYDAVLADVRWHQGAEQAFKLARQQGVATILDADLTPQSIIPLIKLANHVAFSKPGLLKSTAENDITQALTIADNITDGSVYVTCGKSGCYWIEQQQLFHQDGFAVNVVDTTGAGDVFHGALALAIAEKQPLSDAICFANATAALKCTAIGGRQAIPTRQQVEAFITKNRYHKRQ